MQRCPQHTFQVLTKRSDRMARFTRGRVIPPHIWLGVSVESKDYAWRIDDLRDVPCETRFVSAEPLLGSLAGIDLADIAWVIVGGESGPHARPVEASWVRELRDQCLGAGVAFFFKQWGGVHKKEAGRKLDGKVHDAFPLRIVHSVDRDASLLAASAGMEV